MGVRPDPSCEQFVPSTFFQSVLDQFLIRGVCDVLNH